MNFENDIFISYAHLDNQSLIEEQPGWISSFDRALKIRLGQLLGKESRIWRDPKLQGNDFFADTLLERLPEVALLVVILSPRYVNSEWCQRELDSFWECASKSGGVRVAGKSRVFKVVKTPVPLERHPTQLQQLLGYDFFTVDSETGRSSELDLTLGAEVQRKYWMKLNELAQDICELLEILASIDATPSVPVSVPESKDKTVYLAETSSDLHEARNAIYQDLHSHGYNVLPDQPLSLKTAADLQTFVREQLVHCQLSIHLIGKHYGIIPEGATESVVVLQNELATGQSAADLAQLIWIPPDLQTEDERQRHFIEHLEKNTKIHGRVDLLETPFEDLKTLIYQTLNPPEETPRVNQDEGDDLTRIYLICDQRDLENTAPLEDYFFEQGFEVILPFFDEDESQVRLDHEENLRICDAVMIYYGEGSEMWERRKISELRKSAGQGRTKPMAAKVIYVAPPMTPQKARLRTREALLIRQEGDFDPAFLQLFLTQLDREEPR